MIITPDEYLAKLHLIQDQNAPIIALLPSAADAYEIDLNNRTIETPEFLSIENDHKSETIYFKVNRYFDYMDLANTVCVIQYINANGVSKIYPVPFYDITTCADEGKMIFPWCIDGVATEAAGQIQYYIRFYITEEVAEGKFKFLYNLNTIPTVSKILHGMKFNLQVDENGQPIGSQYYDTVGMNAYLELSEKIEQLSRQLEINWIILD